MEMLCNRLMIILLMIRPIDGFLTHTSVNYDLQSRLMNSVKIAKTARNPHSVKVVSGRHPTDDLVIPPPRTDLDFDRFVATNPWQLGSSTPRIALPQSDSIHIHTANSQLLAERAMRIRKLIREYKGVKKKSDSRQTSTPKPSCAKSVKHKKNSAPKNRVNPNKDGSDPTTQPTNLDGAVFSRRRLTLPTRMSPDTIRAIITGTLRGIRADKRYRGLVQENKPHHPIDDDTLAKKVAGEFKALLSRNRTGTS